MRGLIYSISLDLLRKIKEKNIEIADEKKGVKQSKKINWQLR